MTNVIDKSLGLHAQALVLRSRRAEILAANLANADTPNYQAKDLDFGAVLHQAENKMPISTTHPSHMQDEPGGQGTLLYRIPLQPSADGNTVDAQTEKSRFLENALHYQASLQFLDGHIKTLIAAIRGE